MIRNTRAKTDPETFSRIIAYTALVVCKKFSCTILIISGFGRKVTDSPISMKVIGGIA